MQSKKMWLSSLLSVSFLALSGCVSHSTVNENLVLKGTFSDEVVTLDPYFLARQRQAEQSFFGTEHQKQNKNASDDVDVDDEELAQNSEGLQASQEAISSASNSQFGGLEIIWPAPGYLTSVFGRRTLGHRTRMHAGIDIGAAKGTPIVAAADGQVLFAGHKRGYGYAVIISHNDSQETLYAHMSKMLVRVGQYVNRGHLIGLVGKTGHVTGANLHFETRVHGVAYNPLQFLPPSSIGRVKVGMKTPSYTDQINFYQSANHFALNKP